MGLAPESVKAAAWGLLATAILGVLILIGSRNLAHFDAALVAYTFAVLFATFGLSGIPAFGRSNEVRMSKEHGT